MHSTVTEPRKSSAFSFCTATSPSLTPTSSLRTVLWHAYSRNPSLTSSLPTALFQGASSSAPTELGALRIPYYAFRCRQKCQHRHLGQRCIHDRDLWYLEEAWFAVYPGPKHPWRAHGKEQRYCHVREDVQRSEYLFGGGYRRNRKEQENGTDVTLGICPRRGGDDTWWWESGGSGGLKAAVYLRMLVQQSWRRRRILKLGLGCIRTWFTCWFP